MAGLDPILTKKEFLNWVKGSLALLFTEDGLKDFVRMVINQHHQRLLQLVPTAGMQNTCNCTIKSLPECTRSPSHSHINTGPRHLCSRGICNILMDEICKDHRHRGPSWKNTDPQKWCTDAYEVAKCYMPPGGYSNKTSLTETDFNGIVAVVINNRSFTLLIQANLATEPNICTKARQVGHFVRHTKDHLLSDNDLKDYIDDLINLLCDPAYLNNDSSAQDAVRKLKKLKVIDLAIHEKDITEEEGDIKKTLSDILETINKHFSQHQTDPFADIDRIVADKKRELDEHTNKHKEDITRHAKQMMQEIEIYVRTKETKGYEENLKDGLDEWDHPTDCQKPGHDIDIPHSKYRSNCTIMTITRPWKFDKLSLPPSKVDRHIEISNLDDDLSKQLATNAIKLLNDRSSRNKFPKSVADFYYDTACLKLKDLRFIPYIHLQTVLLWHDDKSIGRSKSEIFKNILIYILERGIKQLELDHSPAIQKLTRSMKNWLENETEFLQNSDFLRSLGRLAFYTLFGLEHTPVQSFARPKKDEALKYIGLEEDLELYLKFGLLSQNESFESVALQQSDISFQDKTLQEYFSAMYIYHDTERSNTYRMIRNKCSSIQSILEMCNVFTFLSGLNPGLYTSTLSNILSGPPTESSEMTSVEVDCFLSSDAVVKNFRNGSCLYFMHDRSAYDVMFAFQTMQADCMHEIKVNRQHDCFPHIQDIIINKTSKTEKNISRIKHMVHNNRSNIKTLSVRQVNKEEFEDLLENLGIHLLQSLEMLQFWAVVKQTDLEQILGRNSKTLKYVDISNVIFENNKHTPFNTPLSEECLNAITNMPNLKIISLEQISLTHSELERMVNFVSNRKELTHIEMMHIRCIQCIHHYTCGVELNLSSHEHLLGLCLHSVNINKLYVNTEKLEVFMIGRLPKGTASACLQKIPFESLIHTLSCRTMEDEDLSTFLKVLGRCWKIQKIYFLGTSFGERALRLSPIMQNLEFIEIHRSDITCSALSRLIKSVDLMTQTVNITINGCNVLSEEEYIEFKKDIRENKKFRVQFDDLNQQNREEFRFQKIEG